MSRSVNKVEIIGTLGRDPELKPLPSGGYVVNLSVATDESYTDKTTGQKVEQTEWHRATAYGRLAENIAQFCRVGDKIYFEGKLKTREYEKDGIKRYSTEIVINDAVFLGKREGNAVPVQSQQGGYIHPQAAGYYPQGQYAPPPHPPAYQPPQAQGHRPPPPVSNQNNAAYGNGSPYANSYQQGAGQPPRN